MTRGAGACVTVFHTRCYVVEYSSHGAQVINLAPDSIPSRLFHRHDHHYHNHHHYHHHNHHDHDCHGDQSVGKVAGGCLSPNIGRTKFAGQPGRKLQTATRQFLIILNSIFIIAVIINMFNKIIMVSSYLSFLLHLSQTGKKKNASQR